MDGVLLKELHTKGELSTRTYRILSVAGYESLQQISELSASDLYEMHLGVQSVEELNHLAAKYEDGGAAQKVLFWEPEHVRLLNISALTEGHFETVGEMLDAVDTDYIGFADLCAVYRFLQEKCTPDQILFPLRKRMLKMAPGWLLDLSIDWEKVRPRLTRVLKREACETTLDLINLEQKPENGLDPVERVELKNLIDIAMTQAKI